MAMEGRVFKFGNNITTDQIIPARYLSNQTPEYLAEHCLEDADPTFRERVQPGDVIVAGENFGHGSSREAAAVALKAVGVACVVAGSFGRIFFRNCLNQGIPCLVCPDATDAAVDGGKIKVDLASGEIELDGKVFQSEPMPEFIRRLLESGGLVQYGRRRLEAEKGGGGEGILR